VKNEFQYSRPFGVIELVLSFFLQANNLGSLFCFLVPLESLNHRNTSRGMEEVSVFSSTLESLSLEIRVQMKVRMNDFCFLVLLGVIKSAPII